MIKEGTDILRMRLSTSHIPSNAGRPHFQKTKKVHEQEKASNANPKPPLYIHIIICMFHMSASSFKIFFKKLCQKRLSIIRFLENLAQPLKLHFIKKLFVNKMSHQL